MRRCNCVCCCTPVCVLCTLLKTFDAMEAAVLKGDLGSEDHHSVDWVFNHLDKNGDGQVSREEFMEMAPTILKEAMFTNDNQAVPEQKRMYNV
jgi:Ca2+-binding EF-hand superfamily protein